MLSNASSTAAAETAAAAAAASAGSAAALQLCFLLLTLVASVPPVCVARDIVTGRRQLSAVDEILLIRELVIIVWKPLTNLLLLIRQLVHGWIATHLHVLCLVHSFSIIYGLGLVTTANFLISLSRIEQLIASRFPILSTNLTQGRIRWQNRLLLTMMLMLLTSFPVLGGLLPSAYYWCAGGPEPKESPMLVLLSINSGMNCANFCCSIYLWKVSSGLRDTCWPRNYISAHGWAQQCLVIIIANTLLVPVNTGNFDQGEKIYLNHTFFTLLYGLLDPGLLLLMAARWRQQVRERRLQVAQKKDTTMFNIVIPTIRLDLI